MRDTFGNSYHARDIASVLHPQTNAKTHLEVGPTVIVRGEGVHVIDDEGNRYLDSGAGLWCNSIGYSNERVAKVAFEALNNLAYFPIFKHQSHHAVIDLSEKLLSMAPVPMSKVMLQCSGSEANDTAVKIAWYYWHALGKPEKRKIITRMGSYHGSTCVAISMTGNPAYHRSFGLPFEGFLHTDAPNYYRNARPGESEEQFSQRLADSLEEMILREGPETVAGFWADPVQGNAGALPPPAGYFDKIQAVLRKYDILFVADEVICGFGRTGNVWGSQTFDMRPDMITCAKGLSAAMLPISAVMINQRIFDVLKEESNRNGAFVHGYTYSGHPVACSVALEVQQIYEDLGLFDRVRSLEAPFMAMLSSLAEHPLVGSFSGCGLMGGIEIVRDRQARDISPPEASIASRINTAAHRHGLMMRVSPTRIAFSPPLIISEAEIAEIGEKCRLALDDVLTEGDAPGIA